MPCFTDNNPKLHLLTQIMINRILFYSPNGPKTMNYMATQIYRQPKPIVLEIKPDSSSHVKE